MRRFLRPAEREEFSSASRRSKSATSWENERNRTSACASVLSSSIDMLSSLQYWRKRCSVIAVGIISQAATYLQNLVKLRGTCNGMAETCVSGQLRRDGSGMAHLHKISEYHVPMRLQDS